jgi:pyrroline-5-carboxylate reductase
MGISIISGVIASLESSSSHLSSLMAVDKQHLKKWESHTPGTSTPTIAPPSQSTEPKMPHFPPIEDPSIPTRFLACVSRESSAQNLGRIFGVIGPLGASVEVFTRANVEAATQADVILLWCTLSSLVTLKHAYSLGSRLHLVASPKQPG